TDEHKVNEQAVAALGGEKSIYQRAGLLVRLVRDESPAAQGIRRPFAPRIETLPPPLLRERLAANAKWLSRKSGKGGVEGAAAHPPGWCVAAVVAHGYWPGVRPLEAVVDYPVLKPDGTILCQPGYDADTGLLLAPAGKLPDVPEQPTQADARRARD